MPTSRKLPWLPERSPVDSQARRRGQPMKKVIAILVLTGALPAARAQTNVPPRSLSLQDCVTEALSHNFDVQVARYTPQIDLYNLYGTYGGYDPQFTLGGEHSYNVTPGSLTDNQLQY